MINPLSLLTGWKLTAASCAATALVVAFVTTFAVQTIDKVAYLKLQNQIANEHASNATASLDTYVKQTTQMQASANALLQTLPQFQAKFTDLSKDLKNESAKHPLPDACKPTVERLRLLTVATAAANAAAFGQ